MPSSHANLRSFVGLGPPKPSISLAAFGKRPGWDDHVELGVDTESLAEIRQSLYINGIAANIDAGAWEKLPPDQRLPEFNHSLLHYAPRQGALAARLWSSTDGKGRKKYPLVLCAQGAGLSPHWALHAAATDWLDLTTAPPTRDDFYCLLANTSPLPLATSIPFNFDAAFLQKAGTFLASQPSPA